MGRPLVRLLGLVGALLVVLAATAPSAHAYIDPGSSSFIIQILFGALAAAGLAIATFWRRLRLFFGRLFGRGPSEDESSETGADASSPPGDQP